MAHKTETILEYSLPAIIQGIIQLFKVGYKPSDDKKEEGDNEAYITMFILPAQFICLNLYIAR